MLPMIQTDFYADEEIFELLINIVQATQSLQYFFLKDKNLDREDKVSLMKALNQSESINSIIEIPSLDASDFISAEIRTELKNLLKSGKSLKTDKLIFNIDGLSSEQKLDLLRSYR